MTASAVNVISVRQGCNAPLRIGVSHIGQPLKIAGQVFGRGFGAHAHSEIRLVSEQPMREFRARVGFDDNPMALSQSKLPELVFSVQAGGRTLWSSKPVRMGDAAQEATVTLEGVKELYLHVRASREGATPTSVEYYGQANWVDPEVRLADGTMVELGWPQSTSRATEAASPGGKCASEFPAADRDVIRRLAEEVAQIAAMPEQKRRIGEWKRLNALRHGKPLVMIYTAESPLHELDPGSELTLQTKDSFCRRMEQELRLRLFEWKHVRCDMVMEGAYHVPYVWHDSGLGFTTQDDIRITDPDSPIMGHHYHVQIRDEKDIERIRPPTVLCDWELTERNYQAACELLGGVMPVRKRGMPTYILCPTDELCQWMGIEESMMCLAERPELFHMGMKRLTEAHLHRVRQLKELGLLTADFGNGLNTMSGGLAYTDELPREGSDPERPELADLWGGAAAQLFTAVSPEMHEEFAVMYEKQVLNLFGLAGYGCCEALHNKIHILRKHIPNLRKVSVTPWADVDIAAENIGDSLVYNRKPNPAIFAADRFDLDAARKDFRDFLNRTRGCIVEVCIKDLSTVRNKPQRIFDWAQMADEETAKFA